MDTAALAATAGALLLVALVAFLGGWCAGRRSGRRAARPGPVERASAEQAQRQGRLAERVLTVSHHGVVVVDRDDVVVLANPAARDLGLVERDRLVLPELRALARDVFDRVAPVRVAADPLPSRRVDVEPDARAGQRALTVVGVPVRLDGGDRPGVVALLVDDVTETRRLEAVRRDFVANVSHELKTPVGALTLLAEAIQDAADEPEVVARFAARMQHEGARLGRLVRELIELSRLQGADPLPGDRPVRLAAVLADAADRNRLAAEQAGITVVVRCPEGTTVTGDPAQLTMAVSNLVENAVNYSPAGTRVAVSVQEYEDAGRPMAALAVTDQGIGIAAADLDRVFERFYRIDPARSRATGGTGLGLAIVKHVATNHGGTVGVWSRPGAGSTFTLRLPRPAPAGPPDPAPPARAGSEQEPAAAAGSTKGDR